MASHSKGIQQLLQAEKKAADLVSEARKRKFNSDQVISLAIQCSRQTSHKNCRGNDLNDLRFRGSVVFTSEFSSV